MVFQTLTLEQHQKTWVLTIKRPEALNALNSQVLSELREALQLLNQKLFSEMRAVVLTGSGEKAFVAGADIKEINSLTPNQALEFAKKGQSLFRQIENMKVPMIAAVNGFALGGGCELALACDFIFASETAKFGLPEVTLGLIPGFGGTVRLARVVGQNRAKELTYTGEIFDSTQAHRMGLVNRVVPFADLLPTALKTAETIAARAPIAIQHAKASILKSYDSDIDEAMKVEAEHFSGLFSSQDVKEGTSAFLEKRKPQFSGT